MKGKFLSLAAAFIAASVFMGCSKSHGLNEADVQRLTDGPNSIKGTITGTMLDGTPFNFPYDYHVTTNDGDSENESWIQNGGTYDGDTILWVGQYFFFDRNGYSDYGDNWSASGKYLYLEFYANLNTMKLMPEDYTNGYSTVYTNGMWQNITSSGNRFVYGLQFSSDINNGSATITDLKYDKGTEILSGKLMQTVPNNHQQYSWYDNYNAATITGEFKIYVPKENFQVVKGSGDSGMVYRAHRSDKNPAINSK